MQRNYAIEIKESEASHREYLRKSKNIRLYKRSQLLLLLKSGQAKTFQAAGKLCGFHYTYVGTLFNTYKKEGIESFLSLGYSSKKRKLSPASQAVLVEEAKKGNFSTLWQIRDWLKTEQKLDYTEQGVWYLLKHLKVKLKTGRPVHFMQKEGAQEEFKKNSKKK